MTPIRTLIADDHAIVRMGLAALLESDGGIELVGEAEDGAEAVRLTLALKPDLVIMDLMMPGMDGIDATLEIKRKSPRTKILVLTTSGVSDDLAKVLDAGADGAVTKSTANDRQLETIHAVAGGQRWIAPEIRDLLKRDPPVPKLTDRQKEVLGSVVRGLTNGDIAKQLGIREDSVKEHLNLIFSKLGAANRTEAVATALRKRLLKI